MLIMRVFHIEHGIVQEVGNFDFGLRVYSRISASGFGVAGVRSNIAQRTQLLDLLRIGLCQLNQALAGLFSKVFQLRAERIGYGLAVCGEIILFLWITSLVVELDLRRADVQVLSCAQCAQRTPAEGPMRIIGFGIRGTVFPSSV